LFSFRQVVFTQDNYDPLIPINDDLVKVNAWSTKWLVNNNPQKTETMTISQKLNKPYQPNLIMNNTIISTEHKQLGLQLSDDGNWNKISVSMPSMKTMNSIRLQTIPGIHQHLCHAN
jgi:hypothetical protein